MRACFCAESAVPRPRVGTAAQAATFGFASAAVLLVMPVLVVSGFRRRDRRGQIVEAGLLWWAWLVAVSTIIEVTMAAARNPNAHAGDTTV